MNTASSPMQALRWWRRLFFGIAGVILLYLGFRGIDGNLLASQSATATVIAKEHRKAGTTYRTDKIGNTFRTIPYSTPEMYILKLHVGNKTVEWPVEKSFYDRTDAGSDVRVRYEKRRITGSLKILSVEPAGGK
jgi:hypothetical protein